MSALPPCPCPLCGKPMQRATEVGGGVWCETPTCPLWLEDVHPEILARLAAPRPLPATVRAVLEAADRWGGVVDHTASARLAKALAAWIAAGRPGLEEK
jgi:hypothetical protein